jgi:hypothetical protein
VFGLPKDQCLVISYSHPSYTTFSYTSTSPALRVDALSVAAYAATARHELLRTQAPAAGWIDINVTNTGSVAGCDIVLLFASSPTPWPGQGGAPIRDLVGFERVCLQPGQSELVPFGVTMHDFTVTSPSGDRVAVPGTWTFAVGKPVGATVHVVVQ